jgi:hypothetical protein
LPYAPRIAYGATVILSDQPRTYGVDRRQRAPLLRFMLEALRSSGCRIIHEPEPDEAPFRITFETAEGERMGIIAYAFLANFTPTKNRPDDEHSFQIKYGSKDGELHELWQDPYGVYTTLFLGINPDKGFFVAADPVLHNPTRFFIRLEFKERHVQRILSDGWHAWERKKRLRGDEPVEVLVGGTASSFLRLIQLERDALGEDQGHRHLLAERPFRPSLGSAAGSILVPAAPQIHRLAEELALSEAEVLDVISSARRLKMAVRGWVAEEHLVRKLRGMPGVSECSHIDEEGGVDVTLRFENSRPIRIECKNVLREKTAKGVARIDFQRTRASKGNPCSRFYQADDFEVVAACMHAVTEVWEFQFAPTAALDRLPSTHKCSGRLSNLVRVDERWSAQAADVFRAVAAA